MSLGKRGFAGLDMEVLVSTKKLVIDADLADSLCFTMTPRQLAYCFTKDQLFALRDLLKGAGVPSFHSAWIIKRVASALRIKLATEVAR